MDGASAPACFLLAALTTPLTYFGVLTMVRRHRVHVARKKAIRKAIRNSH